MIWRLLDVSYTEYGHREDCHRIIVGDCWMYPIQNTDIVKTVIE